ncbi:MAG: hypothetical protein JXA73_12060 [Acidobacteria bacterium]|nr:hypothetical protein [Acidobacteriota bacterium]
MLIISERQAKPSLEAVSRNALQWLLKVTRTPMVHSEPDAQEEYRNRHNGLAVYEHIVHAAACYAAEHFEPALP